MNLLYIVISEKYVMFYHLTFSVIAICGSLLSRLLNSSTQSVMAYVDVDQPTVVHFSCPDELVLTGPSTTMCINNTQLEPDPVNVKCVESDDGKLIFVSQVILHCKTL